MGDSLQLRFARSELTEALQAVSRVASTRSAVQAFSGVQVHADAKGIELRATDTEVSLRLPVTGMVDFPGEVLLPGRLFSDIVRSFAAADVLLRTDEQGGAVLECGGAKFDLRTLRNDDFPKLPVVSEKDEAVALPASAFASTVARVSRSVSRDQSRPVLTGILISASESTLRMVATDSYRLAVQTTPLDAPIVGTLEANVPGRALVELARLIESQASMPDSDVVQATRLSNQIVFTVGDASLASRLIDGQFPNYELLIPADLDVAMTVDRQPLIDVLHRVGLMSQKNAPLRLAFTEGTLEVSTQTPDVGEARESIVLPYQGEALTIGFNEVFAREGLESLDGEEAAVVKLTTALRPMLFESVDGTFMYLVMPLRLQ